VLIILACSWVLAGPVFLWHRSGGISRSDFFARNPGYFGYHWQYSKWVILTALVFQMTQQGFFWLAAILLDTTRVAELRAAWNLVQPTTLIFSSLSFVMLPRLADLIQTKGLRDAPMRPEIVKYTLVVLLAALGCAGLAWAFGSAAYRLIYAGKYGGSVGLLYVVALMPVAAGIAGVFSDALRAVEKPGLVFYAYVVGGLLTLAVGVPAILSRGVEGAAWGMVASNSGYAITLVLFYWWVRRRRSIPMT
jgi:O-antigen/teichoic acid export membrane protein